MYLSSVVEWGKWYHQVYSHCWPWGSCSILYRHYFDQKVCLELENLVRRGLALKVYSVGNFHVEIPLKWSLGKCCHVIQLFGVSTMDYCHCKWHENGGKFGHRGIWFVIRAIYVETCFVLRLARLDVSLAHELPNCREYCGCLGHFGLVYHSKVIVSYSDFHLFLHGRSKVGPITCFMAWCR